MPVKGISFFLKEHYTAANSAPFSFSHYIFRQRQRITRIISGKLIDRAACRSRSAG